MITTRTKPDRDTQSSTTAAVDTVASQIALMRAAGLRLVLGSASCRCTMRLWPRNFPKSSPESLHAQMYAVDRQGHARGGVEAVRFLSRRLPLLWPLAVLLHVPGSLPLCAACMPSWPAIATGLPAPADDGSCRLPQ